MSEEELRAWFDAAKINVDEGDGTTTSGTFGSGGFGVFPSNPLPAQVSLSDTAFTASITNIPIAAEATNTASREIPFPYNLRYMSDEE